MSTQAKLVLLLGFSAFMGAASKSDIESTLAELKTTVNFSKVVLVSIFERLQFFQLNGDHPRPWNKHILVHTDVRRKKNEENLYVGMRRDAFKLSIDKLPIHDVKVQYRDFQDYQLKMDSGISKVKNEFKPELQKMSSEIAEMKSAIQRTINQQQKTMSVLTLRIDKLMKSKNEEKQCFKYDDNAASCIQKPFCAFCVEKDFTSNRCDIPENLNSSGCPQSSIINSNKSPEITVGPNDEQSAYTMPLCPGSKRNVTLNFQTSNQPVDIYILLDVSSVGWISQHSTEYIAPLVETVRNLSSDYTFGLGIALDKPKSPFGSHETFSFKNVVRLTKKVKELIDDLRPYADVKDIGDGPDSQLEGMFQTAACKEHIGWRNNSRKVILAIFGYRYYINGDGAKGGITNPFDGLCALNATGFYANELTQDFPSENQIIQIIRNENINVVFALEYYYEVYKALVARLDPPAYAFNPGHWFENLSTGFTQVMQEMNSVIELEQSKTSDDVRVTLYSSCNGQKDQRTNKCKNIVNGTSKFEVEFEMLRCPTLDSNRNQLIKISPKGLPISAKIQMRLFCNCTF